MFRRLPRYNKILEIYLTQILYGIGIALIGVFIPIYLLTLGYSLQQVFLYVIVQHLMQTICSPFVASLSHKIGLKKTTLVRIPFFLVNFLTLYGLSTNPNIHFLIPAFFGGISVTLFWIPMHTLFTSYSHHKKRGSEVGMLRAMPTLFKTVAPALGGIIAVQFGFPVLILIGLCIIAVSTTPLFLSKDITNTTKFSWSDLWTLRHHRFVAASTADGFLTIAVMVLYPIHIFLSLGTVDGLGYIKTLGDLVFALTAIAVGRQLDNANRTRWMILFATLFAISIAIRPFVTTAVGLSAAIIFGALTAAPYAISYSSLLYDFAEKLKHKADEFIVVREIFLNLARVSLLGLCLILGEHWRAGFFIAAIAGIFMIRITKGQVHPH